MNHSEMRKFFNHSFFSKVQIWCFGVKKIFFAVFGWYFIPWLRIRIFLRIRIPEAKILRIKRIRILSTACFTGINAQITLKEKIINFQITQGSPLFWLRRRFTEYCWELGMHSNKWRIIWTYMDSPLKGVYVNYRRVTGVEVTDF